MVYIAQTLHCGVYSPDSTLATVAWAKDEGEGEVGIGGAIEHHRELVRGNGGHHQIPQY